MLPSRVSAVPPEDEKLHVVVPRTRRAFTIYQRVWAILRRNLGLRIISLLLAIALWMFVNAGEHGSVQSYTVPISYTGLPAHYIITNRHPETIRVDLSGPRTLLSIIQPSRLRVRIDLSGVGVGQASFRIEPDSFGNLPRTTTVTSIAPSQIILDIDRIVVQNMPVHMITTGNPAPGYRVASVTADPSKVRVRGPSRELARLDEVDTDPVDLSGITGNVTREATVPSPGPHTHIEAQQIAVNVTVAPVIIQKEYRGVRVQVRNSENQTRTWPSTVNLTVRGPQLTLDHLTLNAAAFVDADGLIPGYYDAFVEIDLPNGVELVHQSSEKVKLRIYRGKAPEQVGR